MSFLSKLFGIKPAMKIYRPVKVINSSAKMAAQSSKNPNGSDTTIRVIHQRPLIEPGMIGYSSYVCYKDKIAYGLEVYVSETTPYSEQTFLHTCGCGQVLDLREGGTASHHHFYLTIPRN